MLLTTKITLPPLVSRYIGRARLLQKVAAFPQARLLLVCAPAGFGKTSWLVAHSHRLREENTHVVWYALDKQDNDPGRFAAYLMRAFQAGWKGDDNGPDDDHDLEAVVTFILNQLSGDVKPVAFVLDDYHLITNPAVHHSIGIMLDHLPANCRLIMGTRADPPIQLSRLRARGQIVELRAADLRFTAEEIDAFVRQSEGTRLSEDSLRQLETISEGWITALWLIRMAVDSSAQPFDDAAVTKHLSRFSTAHRHIFDYFADEVFGQQSLAVQQFLLHTSILNRLFPDICVVVTDDTNAPYVLEQVARGNLFLVQLSDHEPLYRYHHLFENFLRNRLRLTDPALYRALHQSAAAWHHTHGNIVEAVDHALSGEAHDEAAQLIVDKAWESLSARGELMTILSWLPEFPEVALKAHPRLSLCFSRAFNLTGNLEKSTHYLQLATDGLADLPDTRRDTCATGAIVYNYQATLAGYRGELSRGFAFIEDAASQAHQLDVVSQVRVVNTRAYLHFLKGEVGASRATYEKALELARRADHDYLAIDAVYFLAQLDLLEGCLRSALERCDHQLEKHTRRIAPISALWTVQARVHYEQNRPQDAEVLLRDAARLAQRGNISEILWLSCTLLGLLLASQGKPDEGEVFVRKATGIAQHYDSPPVQSIVAAAAARMKLYDQRVDEASRWADAYEHSEPVEFMRDYEDLTLVRVWLASGKAERALPFLSTLIDAVEVAGRMSSALEARVLRALAFQAMSRMDDALRDLGNVLEAAADEGYVRLFLDEGPPMVRLLRRAVENRLRSDYAGWLVGEAGKESRTLHPADALTEREIEVLELVAEGATNQAIADTLVISLGTVKSHVNHIMSKLDAQNRTEAVAIAQSLGILRS